MHPLPLSAPMTEFPEELSQQTNILEALVSIEGDDSSLRHLNLNNHADLTSDIFTRLFEALEDNTRLRKLELANLKLGDTDTEVRKSRVAMGINLVVMVIQLNMCGTHEGFVAVALVPFLLCHCNLLAMPTFQMHSPCVRL